METTTIRRPASLDVVYNEPNEETKEAIREVMNRKENPAEDVYDNVDEMFKALGVEV